MRRQIAADTRHLTHPARQVGLVVRDLTAAHDSVGIESLLGLLARLRIQLEGDVDADTLGADHWLEECDHTRGQVAFHPLLPLELRGA